jgi:hypothetical protein
MTVITFPADTKSIVDGMRSAIGRPVEFVSRNRTPCPTCEIDPITDSSIDSFCITCSGEGYLYTYSGTTITGHVTWASFDKLSWVPGGQYFDGDCRLQIEYTLDNITVINNAKHVIVDGKQLRVADKIFRGVPTINRIILNLSQD